MYEYERDVKAGIPAFLSPLHFRQLHKTPSASVSQSATGVYLLKADNPFTILRLARGTLAVQKTFAKRFDWLATFKVRLAVY